MLREALFEVFSMLHKNRIKVLSKNKAVVILFLSFRQWYCSLVKLYLTFFVTSVPNFALKWFIASSIWLNAWGGGFILMIYTVMVRSLNVADPNMLICISHFYSFHCKGGRMLSKRGLGLETILYSFMQWYLSSKLVPMFGLWASLYIYWANNFSFISFSLLAPFFFPPGRPRFVGLV